MSHIARKPAFCICKNKGAVQLRGNRTADLHLCFCYFLNSKFQTSSHLRCLFSLVCVGPCQKTQRLLFSGSGSYGYLRLHPVKEIQHPCLVIIAHFHCHFNNRLLRISILSLQLRHHYRNINIWQITDCFLFLN